MKTHHQTIRRELAWAIIGILLLFPSICLYSLDLGLSSNKVSNYDTHFLSDSLSVSAKITRLKTAYHLHLKSKDDSLKYKGLSELAVQLSELKDTLLFKKVAAEAKLLAEHLGDAKFIADSHWNYGSYYLQKKDYDSSYYHYDRAYKIYSTQNNYYYAGKMLYNLAFISTQIRDFTGAEMLLFNAIENFETADKPKQLYLSFNQLGAIADNLEEYENALDYYNKAAGFMGALQDPQYYQVELWNNMGVMYQKTLKYERALYYFKKAFDFDEVLQRRPSLYAKLLDNRAYTHFLMNSPVDILMPMHRAMNIRDSLDDIPGAVVGRIHLAEVYAKEGDSLSAINYAKKALILALESGLNRDVLETLEILSLLEPSNKLGYLQQHIDLNKKLNHRERSIRNKFTSIRYETEKYISENERLFRERTWIIAFSVVSTLLFMLLYWNTRQRAKNKRLVFEREQQQNNEDMFLLALENKTILERGRNLERLRISEELHDGILARMFSVRFKWAFLELSGTTENVNQHKDSIDELAGIETDIRHISHDLRNELIWCELEFLDEIKNTIQERSEFGNFQYRFHSDNALEWESLAYLSKTNISRIMDEIFQNIIRHAKATYVIIEFTVEDRLLNISVMDNGKGFKLKTIHKGIGLKNLKNRAEKLNGEVAITSNIGYGTSIKISIPQKP